MAVSRIIPAGLRSARPIILLGGILLFDMVAASDALHAADPSLSNVDSTLQRLSSGSQIVPLVAAPGAHTLVAQASSSKEQNFLTRSDASGRVLVHVYLDGTAPMSTVTASLAALNAKVLGANTTYRHGVVAAYLPVAQIANASSMAGVRALTAEHSPQLRVGKYTSQGTGVLRTDLLNQAGLKGDGITVGVLSDSFNTAYENTSYPPATTAQQDVATGDLPVVNVLEDFPDGTDEGRAMCQIVYDEAPHCQLAFATADVSEVDFANNIVLLRTQANASVIVDDVGYLDEPVFSDGFVAQAVNTVATSRTLPGKPVAYLSAAGNDGNNGYRSAYRNLPDAEVRQDGNHGNLKLDVTDPKAAHYLDPSLTAGGWYNWNRNGGAEPATTLQAPGPTTDQYLIFLQWDDLFDQDHGITTRYNFLVFDAKGNYRADLSSTANSFSIQEPIQAIGYLNLGTQYQIAITRTKQTDPKAGPIPGTHQLALYTTLDGESTLLGEYFQPAPLNVPIIYGHPTAKGAIAVAAYDFSWRAALPYAPELENFTTPGPAAIYFDANDNRLASPEIRAKPEVAGVDGVVTTFFGSPYYNYPFAFFGTSAAAPSVAGVAALMQQATGGPGCLDPATIKQALEASTHPRNSTVERTQAYGADSSGFVSVSALGQWYFDSNYMTVNFSGASGDDVEELTIDGTASGLTFNTTYFTLGNSSGLTAQDVIVVTPTTSTPKFTLKFKKGTFTSGSSFAFTVGQDVAGTFTGYTQDDFGVGVEAEDLAYGSTATFSFGAPKHASLTAPFKIGNPTCGFSPPDGYGLIDGVAAVEAVLPSSTKLQIQ
jgi:hypothetical protein